MLDIAIIGSGPAGLSAAINAAQRNKKVAVFGRGMETSMLYKAEKVDNYIGMPSVSGRTMLEEFYNHAKSKGVEIKKSKVYQIFKTGDHYTLNADNNFVEAKKVIIASGIEKAKPIEGEKEFLGRGVSYCATCDGMLYRGQEVAFIADSKAAEEDLKFLCEICACVYFIPLYKFEGELPENVKVIKDKPVKIYGTEFVEGVKCADNDIKCTGVFIIKESMPVSALIDGIETENGAIKVDRQMETSVKGIFAAGDCTGAPYQISKAVGEGLVAALNAVKEL